MKLEIRHNKKKKKTGKALNAWRLNNTLLSSEGASNEAIEGEIKTCRETNENRINLSNATKTVLKGRNYE